MSVVVEKVTKRYAEGGPPAAFDVSFEAKPGAITSIIGPSGAGKSTILRLIAGLEVPDEGRILIGGVDASTLPIQARGVGLVFQNYALFQNMTVRDNIAFGLTVRKKPKKEIDARVEKLLDLVQLGGKGARYPRELSGGQRQRIAFARALAIDPKLLLLDEPFGALDARVRLELREWLESIQKETGVTTLLVTHDQEEALELSEHVVLMFDGRVGQAGSPREVYDFPVTPEVASFLGANLLRGPAQKAPPTDEGKPGIPAASSTERAHAFVRSEDLKLTRDQSGGQDVRSALVRRLKVVGGHVKVSLDLPEGETVSIDLSRAEVATLALVEGEQVFVDVRAARIFYGEFDI